MKVKIKKLDKDAVIPSYAKVGDAGMDLTAISCAQGDNYIEYGTGLAVQIPEGFVGLIFPRSSITNRGVLLKNSVGIIDSGYVGEIKFRFHVLDNFNIYEIGERIGQLIIIPYPHIDFVQVDNLSDTERGLGGYGSTGK
jgi:dUTP pyrophosphatase